MSWYYRQSGANQGPIERGALADLLRSGIVTPQIEVSEDTESWMIAARVPGLMDEVYAAPQSTDKPEAAAPAPAPSAPPAPISTPEPKHAQGSNELLKAISATISQQPIATHAAAAKPAPQPVAIDIPGSSPVVSSPEATPDPEPTEASSDEQPADAAELAVELAAALATSEADSSPAAADSAGSQGITIDTPTFANAVVAAPLATPAPAATATLEPVAAAVVSSDPSSDLEPSATPDEPAKPTGPVGHIVLDPVARQQAKSKSQEGGTSIFKLSVFGLLGLAAVLVGGFFTATKVFGLDLRPASVDKSVSKFMIEEPVLVVRADLQSILDSKVYRKTLPADQRENNPLLSKFSYLKDTGEIVVASSSLDPKNPNLLCIVNLKRDYRTEFVANLLKDATTEYVGDFQMHIDPNAMGGQPIALCLPEPRTLLVGSPYLIKTVLERKAHPKLYPRESALIASTKNGSNISVALSLKPAKDKLSEFRDKLKEMPEQQREFAEKGLDDAQYVTDRVKSVHIDCSFGETVDVALRAECGSEKKATKVAEKLTSLMSRLGAGDFDTLGRFTPLPNGTKVEITTSFDPSNSDFGNALLQGFAQRGRPF